MIERPAAAMADVVRADAGGSEAVEAAPLPQVTAPGFPEPAPTSSSAPVLAGNGPDPALAPDTPPKFAERTRAQFGPPAPRAARMRVATRVSTRTEHMNYRAIFACCTEATETPTE
jgi:hypothetical protein